MAPKGDEPYSSTDEEGANNQRAKRRKGPKACDVCRRKKIRCDPDPSGEIGKSCVNCAVFKTECTYTYVAKKRRTQQAYIDNLQNRLGKVEKLLVTLAPDIDLSKALSDGGDATLSLSAYREPRAPSPLRKVPCLLPSRDVKPSQVVAAFTEWRDNKSNDDDDEDDEVERLSFVPLAPSSSPASLEIGNHAPSKSHRFHGNSSGLVLIKKVMGMKKESTGDGTDLLDSEHFIVKPDPWEARLNQHLPSATFDFPPMDLIEYLIDVYFKCINDFLPIFHRPTFDGLVRDRTHERDPSFGAVLLLVCAAASRWSEDPRVLPKPVPGSDEKQSWTSAGWDYYFQVHQRYRRNFMHSTSVQDLQMMALGCVYHQGTSNSSPGWQMAGLGLRLALEAGVHRRKRPKSGCLLESELWKRAFWSLVLLDRLGSASLGRPCAIWEEDIDLDLPLEVDDEYMTVAGQYKQPPDKPSRMSYFNSFVKLSQILIGALRTIYPVSKSRSVFRLVGPTWEQEMVAALDSSLNRWIDTIPDHLRWDPNGEVDLTWYQSSLLHSTYYYVQIVVHRPYITPSRKPSFLTFPSLAICTNAARSCSHILDAHNRRGGLLLPQLNHYAFTAAIVLLFNIWGKNKPGVRVDWQTQVADVHTCMKHIKRSTPRWRVAAKLGGILRDLVFVGDFPLPQGASPPAFPDANNQGQKRARDSEHSPESSSTHPDTPAASSSCSTDPSGSQSSNNHNFETGCLSSSDSCDYELSKQEPVLFGTQDASYLPPIESQHQLNMGHVCLPIHPPQINDASNPLLSNDANLFPYVQQQPGPPQNPHTANDVLTALESAYLTGNPSGVSDGVVMDVAHQTFDVWANAPSGFQWDEWQQFTNVVQNPPTETQGVDMGGTEPFRMW